MLQFYPVLIGRAMITKLIIALLISILVYVLLLGRSEGFDNPPRASTNPAWAKLSDDEVLELLVLRFGAMYAAILIDNSKDPDAAQTLKEMSTVIPADTVPVKNKADIKALRNILNNKASQNKNVSVAFEVIQSKFKDGLKLTKLGYAAQQKKDQNAIDALVDDGKGLVRKMINEIKAKVPNFPFNPELKKGFPEGFIEVPKPTATECKRFFKCSSIYAA
jgi:hypothetical protein